MATTGPRALCGSSPRAWGTPLSFFLPPRPLRFIPTRVGNTLYLPLAFSVTCGSSPRAWGTHVPARQRRWCRRFIPTRVGNTHASVVVNLIFSVHPHARGEHLAAYTAPRRVPGSSPRAWGTRFFLPPPPRPLRFIPTRVGNARRVHRGLRHPPVHPHARGEHTRPPPPMASPFGSSPRAWGTHAHGARIG